MNFSGHLFYLNIGLILLVRQVTTENMCDRYYSGIGEAVTISSECFSNGTVDYSWSSDDTVNYLQLDYSCNGPDASQFDPEEPPIPWGDGTFLQGVSVASIPNWDNGWSCSFFGCYEIESRGPHRFSVVQTPCTTSVSESATLPMLTSTQVPSPTPTSVDNEVEKTASLSHSSSSFPRAPSSNQDLTVVYIVVALVVGCAAIITLTVIISLISCRAPPKSHKQHVLLELVEDKPATYTDIQQFYIDIDTKLPPAKSEQSVFDPLNNINDLLMTYNQSPSLFKGVKHSTHFGPPSISKDTPTGSLSIIPEVESDTKSTASIPNHGKSNSHFLDSTLDINNYDHSTGIQSEGEIEVLDSNPDPEVDRCSTGTERAELKTEVGTPPSGIDDPHDSQSVEYDTEATDVDRSFEVSLECCDTLKDSSGLSVASGYIQLTHSASQFTHSLPLNGKNTSADTNTPPFNIGLASESDIDNLATPELQSHETEIQAYSVEFGKKSSEETLKVASLRRQNAQSTEHCLAGSDEECNLVLDPNEGSTWQDPPLKTHYPTPQGYIPNNDSGFSG